MFLIFDTETTGLPRDFKAPITDTENWPRCIQLAWQEHDAEGKLLENHSYLIKPEGFDIPFQSEQIHGISTELAHEIGVPLTEVLEKFNEALNKAKFVVGQNIDFDINVTACEFYRLGIQNKLTHLPSLDTCTEITAQLCQLKGGKGGKFKLPTLSELHEKLFGKGFADAHNASADVEATTRCFLELIRTRVFTQKELLMDDAAYARFFEVNTKAFELIGLKHLNLKAESKKLKKKLAPEEESISIREIEANEAKLEDLAFSHLHNHSQFSILQATSEINALIAKSVEFKMPAVALTDSGNMMAAFHFMRAAANHNKGVKQRIADSKAEGKVHTEKPLVPILGCEFNVCRNHTDKSVKDDGYQVVLLAKNKAGYHNLAKMASISNMDGFYYKPRIDKQIIEQYKENLICLTGNLYGEIPSLILNVGESQAEEALLWWKEQFGDDLYIEVMRHGQEDEDRVNEVLKKFAKKHAIQVVATNNTFYINQEDALPHDILLCVKDNEKQETPIGRGRGFRFGMPNNNYYYRSQEEMKSLFADWPEAISNTNEIVAKCEAYELARDVLLPKFDIPEEFKDPQDETDSGKRGENAFLRHLTLEGAKKRYQEISVEIKERIDFELETIANTGYPGYFLIVQDFCNEARKMGVSVGPGRGSAAGSVVAYCTGITNIDPIKYDLLFERFLNPDRVSLPDIDIDFDDEGRQKVIDYVIDKYGAKQVAQIITYGSMAAKSAIRDASRVMELPLNEADALAKLVPEMKLNKLFSFDDNKLKEEFKGNPELMAKAIELRSIAKGNDLRARILNQAQVIEGSIRNTGIHACGVIITPEDITNLVPVALAKDNKMMCTQFDNSVVESAGLLKMDFLGLKTLTLIKDACRIIKEKHGIELDPETFPLDDEKTYALFQRGDTVGIFQYESAGMQKYLRELKPTKFEDLIAMNALYRPGPLEYIPSFINRKHGKEPISYDLDDMEEYLKETYGITVYQEQVMLLSQKLAGFTKGEADVLRKAMGKKQKDVLDKMKPKFVEQASAKGHDAKKLEKIWTDWEAFASYAFNKSHSTCYAWVAYQTAYIKANYPAEYMASVLSNNMNNISEVTIFMEECRRSGIPVLGPDINESELKFTVNKEGAIRFGLGALKGVGESAVNAIIKQRKDKGHYTSIFDFARRIDLRACNKKAFESLALGGGFDSFESYHRAQYFTEDHNNKLFIENLIRFGAGFQESENSQQASLFGDHTDVEIPEPVVPEAEEWPLLLKLKKEREVVGIYISGHPLDDYKLEIDTFCSHGLSALKEPKELLNKDIKFAGIITSVSHEVSKTGKPYGRMTIEDYNDSHDFMLFGEDYIRSKAYMEKDWFVFVKARVEKKPWMKDDRIDISIKQIEMLSDVRDKLCKQINVNIDLDKVDEILIHDLHALLSAHTGKCNLMVNVIDREHGYKIPLMSKSIRVTPSNELLNQLNAMPELSYNLN